MSLAAAADVVLAAESARFTMAYTGIGPPDGGATLLVNSLGLHRALAVGLLNSRLTVFEAQAAGLVHAVHPDAELEDEAQQVLAALLASSRSAQVATKRLLRVAAQPLAEASCGRRP